MPRVQLRPSGSERLISVEYEQTASEAPGGFVFHIDGQDGAEVSIDANPDQPTGCLRVHHTARRFAGIRQGDRIDVWVEGHIYSFDLVPMTPQRSRIDEHVEIHDRVTAPMPGRVLDIKVGEGSEFAIHQTLVVLESMKMEMTISVPHTGRVRKIHCAVGDLVDKGALLMELDCES